MQSGCESDALSCQLTVVSDDPFVELDDAIPRAAFEDPVGAFAYERLAVGWRGGDAAQGQELPIAIGVANAGHLFGGNATVLRHPPQARALVDAAWEEAHHRVGVIDYVMLAPLLDEIERPFADVGHG